MLFSTFIRNRIPCPFCDGILHMNNEKTIQNYYNPGIFKIENIESVVDTIMDELMIFECEKCEAEVRYTFGELERLARKIIKEDYVIAISRGNIPHPSVMSGVQSVLIQCSKCPGFNGRGACPEFIYNKCEIKRLPVC